MQKLDINLLHENAAYLVEHSGGRRSGRTVNMLASVLGCVDLAEPGETIVILVPTPLIAQSARRELIDFARLQRFGRYMPLSGWDFKFDGSPGVVKIIVVERGFSSKLRGLRYKAFFDHTLYQSPWDSRRPDVCDELSSVRFFEPHASLQ